MVSAKHLTAGWETQATYAKFSSDQIRSHTQRLYFCPEQYGGLGMASEEMQAAAELIRAAGLFNSGDFDLAAMRQTMEETVNALPEDISRGDIDADGIPACQIAAPDVRKDRCLLYFHGGGYVMGSLNTHAELMGRLSQACRAPVLGIDYRLAPESPYPAAVEDAVASYDRLLNEGIAADKIVIAGDSAGGGLTLACLVALKDQGKPQPAGAVLLSPWTDLTGSGDSMTTRAELDPMVSADMVGPMAELYSGDTDPADPYISPLFADLSGLAPMLIQVGDHEILLDDSTRLAERAKAQGAVVEIEIYDGAFHVFQSVPNLPESADALASIREFFDRVTG
jgi:acetyl esterase/lipase